MIGKGRCLRCLAAVVVVGGGLLACAHTPPPYPHESVLALIAELKLHLAEDPYLRPPGRDLDGRNIFRLSLQRLDHLEALLDAAYTEPLTFARGACWERLGEWTQAAEAFERAGAVDGALGDLARTRAQQAQRMATLLAPLARVTHLDGWLNALDIRDRRLRAWLDEAPPHPYGGFVRCEMERAQIRRVRFWQNHRTILPEAVLHAREAADRLIEDYADSARAPRHRLVRGALYETLARDETARHPPESAAFDPRRGWTDWIDRARRDYRHVAQWDGQSAKPEGQARLSALDAYAMGVVEAAR